MTQPLARAVSSDHANRADTSDDHVLAGVRLRAAGDGNVVVRLLTEVLVPELMAARAWQAQRM